MNIGVLHVPDVTVGPITLPAPLIMAGAAAAALLITLWVLAQVRPEVKDPQRLFTTDQKQQALAWCGYRCEHKAWFWRRCQARATQGDHVYPHSRGGRTVTSNLQMLCATHNRRKSALVPSLLYVHRLQRRRRRYYPAGAPRHVRKYG